MSHAKLDKQWIFCLIFFQTDFTNIWNFEINFPLSHLKASQKQLWPSPSKRASELSRRSRVCLFMKHIFTFTINILWPFACRKASAQFSLSRFPTDNDDYKAEPNLFPGEMQWTVANGFRYFIFCRRGKEGGKG